MNKLIISILSAILLASCTPQKEQKVTAYFDIKALFTKQIAYLNKQKPVFEKKVEINAEKETKEMSQIEWAKELAPFIEMDINKAAYLGSYDIIETDSSLNYTLKKDEKKPIASVLILKNKGETAVTFVEMTSQDKNMLYSWQKTVSANFKNGQIINYKIKGNQKLMFFSEENYRIEGKRLN
jgi:hypothetical protein